VLASLLLKIDYHFNIEILLFLFSLWLCFKTEKFGAQFGELENVIKSHKKL